MPSAPSRARACTAPPAAAAPPARPRAPGRVAPGRARLDGAEPGVRVRPGREVRKVAARRRVIVVHAHRRIGLALDQLRGERRVSADRDRDHPPVSRGDRREHPVDELAVRLVQQPELVDDHHVDLRDVAPCVRGTAASCRSGGGRARSAPASGAGSTSPRRRTRRPPSTRYAPAPATPAARGRSGPSYRPGRTPLRIDSCGSQAHAGASARRRPPPHPLDAELDPRHARARLVRTPSRQGRVGRPLHLVQRGGASH